MLPASSSSLEEMILQNPLKAVLTIFGASVRTTMTHAGFLSTKSWWHTDKRTGTTCVTESSTSETASLLVVTMAANLDDCCVRWVGILTDHRANGTPKQQAKMSQVLAHAHKVCLGTIHKLKDRVLDPRIWVSIASLGYCLNKVLYDVFFEE